MVDTRQQDTASLSSATPTCSAHSRTAPPPRDPASSLLSLPSLPSSTSDTESSQVTPHSSSYTSWTKPVQVIQSAVPSNIFKEILSQKFNISG